MRLFLKVFLFLIITSSVIANEIDNSTVVIPARPKVWNTFDLSQVRLISGSPFFHAMTVAQEYLIDMDINRMLPGRKDAYPGSNQPENTRPGDTPHYISGVSLMYAQTGDKRFLERSDFLIKSIAENAQKNSNRHSRIRGIFARILNGELELKGPDEMGYPWGGMGNIFYGIHKWHAAYRDAYLYCGNQEALKFWIKEAEPITEFVLRANPDLFDGMLDIEHGGMNEVYADLYAITGDERYMQVSKKFNHQKVILNIANGKDVLCGRHANMQVPTFVGTARQYQLTGDDVSFKATENFLNMVYNDHMTCIGGNSRYERFGLPGNITSRLGYTACETCNTYNMLKVALNQFESTGDLKHMDYFERALYNHILASQDPKTGGVTYYTSLMPGGFKSYSDRFNLHGVWCCVGTGMENHSKYGEAIYFHNHKDLYINLFIPSKLDWKEEGLKLKMETKFPEEDIINLTIEENNFFDKQIYIRYPSWAGRRPRVWINDSRYDFESKPGSYIRLSSNWAVGDKIKIEMPQDFRFEESQDDEHMLAIFHGPLVLAGELGVDRMPGSDQVDSSLKYSDWITPKDDIPVLIANRADINSWLKPIGKAPLHFKTINAGMIGNKVNDITLLPYYKTHNQRYNLYWKFFTSDEYELRSKVVFDEVDTSSIVDEKDHNLSGMNDSAVTHWDDRSFWEHNCSARIAKNGGWFSYDLKIKPEKDVNYLVVRYWGSSEKRSVFDIYVDGQLLKSENMWNRSPLTFFDKVYELPNKFIDGKKVVTIKFQAINENSDAGPVLGLKTTSNPDAFNFISY